MQTWVLLAARCSPWSQSPLLAGKWCTSCPCRGRGWWRRIWSSCCTLKTKIFNYNHENNVLGQNLPFDNLKKTFSNYCYIEDALSVLLGWDNRWGVRSSLRLRVSAGAAGGWNMCLCLRVSVFELPGGVWLSGALLPGACRRLQLCRQPSFELDRVTMFSQPQHWHNTPTHCKQGSTVHLSEPNRSTLRLGSKLPLKPQLSSFWPEDTNT